MISIWRQCLELVEEGGLKVFLNRVLEIGGEGGYSTRGTRKGLEELRGRKKLCPQSEVSKIGVLSMSKNGIASIMI